MTAEPVPDVDGDLVVLVQACSAVLGDATLERVRDDVGPDVRFHDGYVFQHLLVGPCTVSELARRLGITQQAASKHVADLVARDLVTKHRSPGDGRAWQVELSARGRRAVDAARRARAALLADCEDALGSDAMEQLLGQLRELSDHLGALDVMMARRLKPEPAR